MNIVNLYTEKIYLERTGKKKRNKIIKTSKKDMSFYSTGVHSGWNPSLLHRVMGNQALRWNNAEGVETDSTKLTGWPVGQSPSAPDVMGVKILLRVLSLISVKLGFHPRPWGHWICVNTDPVSSSHCVLSHQPMGSWHGQFFHDVNRCLYLFPRCICAHIYYAHVAMWGASS